MKLEKLEPNGQMDRKTERLINCPVMVQLCFISCTWPAVPGTGTQAAPGTGGQAVPGTGAQAVQWWWWWASCTCVTSPTGADSTHHLELSPNLLCMSSVMVNMSHRVYGEWWIIWWMVNMVNMVKKLNEQRYLVGAIWPPFIRRDP